jgi:hypothetical protein
MDHRIRAVVGNRHAGTDRVRASDTMMPALKPLLPSGPAHRRTLAIAAPWLRKRLTHPFGSIRRAKMLERVISTALATFLDGELSEWRVCGRLDGRSGNVIVRVGPDARSGGLLKISDSAYGRTELERQTSILQAMHADSRLGSWRQLLPRVIAAGPVGDAYCVLETRLPADDRPVDLSEPDLRARFETSAISAIFELSRSTADHVAVTPRDIDRWVREPMSRVRTMAGDGDRRILGLMEGVLAAQIAGRRVAIGWVHGDYHPANILCDLDGSVVGIVDWCAAQGDGMVVLDVVNLILLAWLHHVAQYIATEPPGVINPLWTRRNVRSVLRAWQATLEGSSQL